MRGFETGEFFEKPKLCTCKIIPETCNTFLAFYGHESVKTNFEMLISTRAGACKEGKRDKPVRCGCNLATQTDTNECGYDLPERRTKNTEEISAKEKQSMK
ncbi:hypothetical protein PAXRUDRAFT_555603 [Paxillus rubicundulus Ve08.2h10]|uniref:Uncharacterized protein n=1 Tax=Paxillus rubicundulus Ve08.2h10 TaxID=930991 RepID=A0A0D0DZU1_9AGAM|nr:hypothetical protein PAXRUDRAFT_555603 [Paxillus rubicundulus Ve08.2h10]